jgi:hypothetical protein
MSVKQHQPLKTCAGKFMAYGHQLLDQDLGGEADGATETTVLWGEANALQRQPQDGQAWLQRYQNCVQHSLSKQAIRSERQLGAVLLDRPPGPDNRASWLGCKLLNLRPGQLLKVALLGHFLRTDPYSVGLSALSGDGRYRQSTALILIPARAPWSCAPSACTPPAAGAPA